MKKQIVDLLTVNLNPTFLQIIDDSAKHADHNSAAKAGGTHFSLKIISANFSGKSRIERHRMIYKILDAQLKGQVHALAITALTPEE